MATPDGYSGLLRMATPATGVLGTLPKGQPGLGEVIAGLGRDSRVYNGGGSSLY